MEGIATALAVQQDATRSQIAIAAVKMAAQSQQQMANLLDQAAQAGQQQAANPAHLGQSIDTYA